MRRFRHVNENLYQFWTPADSAKTAEQFFYEGQLAEEKHQYEEALACYRKCLERKPNYAPAWINIGTFFYYRGQWSKAAELYSSAVVAAPDYAMAHFCLGNALDNLGHRRKAVKHFLRAVRLAPDYADAHYNLALMYERLNNEQSALKHWQLYTKYDHSGPWANHARRQIELLQSRLPPRRLSLVRSESKLG